MSEQGNQTVQQTKKSFATQEHGIPARIRKALKGALLSAGYNIERLSDEERAVLAKMDAQQRSQSLESIFGDELPKLQDLRQRYSKVNLPVAVHSVWGGRRSDKGTVDIGWGGLDLRTFRGHNAYVWNYAGTNIQLGRLRYYLYCEALRGKPETARLFEKLDEDGAFGCFTLDHPEIGKVSRDLMDSVNELDFLHRHLGLLDRNDLRIVDIGAGYGRLAHRTLTAMPELKTYTCLDAVAESTFLCDFYLRYRGLDKRAEVVPLDEIETRLTGRTYDLALNIHSFSECTYTAIVWWLQKLVSLGVRHLLITPNHSTKFLSNESDHSKRDYSPVLEQYGFRLIAEQPVFSNPTIESLMGVSDRMYLFERTDV